jgi:hypothetical protein
VHSEPKSAAHDIIDNSGPLPPTNGQNATDGDPNTADQQLPDRRKLRVASADGGK